MDAIFYLVRGGIAWAELPREFPSHQTVYGIFTRCADTVPGGSRGYDAGKKINGGKRHIAVDTGGLLLAVVVSSCW